MSALQSDRLAFWNSLKKADFSEKTALWLSVWFGMGLVPRAPGTMGTLGAVPLAVAFSFLGLPWAVTALVLFIFLALWSSGKAARILDRPDPGEIVIDEVAGFLVTLFLVPISGATLAAGFVFFRVFDILKPYPVKRLERFEGGKGILLDDLMAGLYANLALRLFLWIF
ncbi:MAG: phosphatidylglycerophosphatase A [Deltaproteobacteria bacterium]|nr:phosphatidylglycerophosphatase A [Deltaproteobacteria bacterium]MBW2016643.1 phosphatidylglycerophosphatase A [Deltaproteobacteria bacterium]MBW2130129.1 phosphatidylglycerophosphatase A [Deltaproteobacteria bacterium]MBW2303751.1 phosphatidylglycerophosphatase A [Deltaproteobacteria bacterium]